MHTAEPSWGENVPFLQALHFTDPLHDENLPDGQFGQSSRDLRELNDPGGQLDAGAGTVVTQSVAPSAAVVFPVEHEMQVSAPGEGWYWPNGQRTHGARPPLYMPAVHVELQLAEPPMENSPEEHTAQLAVVAEVEDEYVPGAQAVHAAEPEFGPYVPA